MKQSVHADGWRRQEEMRKSRGQSVIDSNAMLRYLNLTPHATEKCQRFLTRKDFLYTQINSGGITKDGGEISVRMGIHGFVGSPTNAKLSFCPS